MTLHSDDTQPRVPAVTINPEADEDEPGGGPGCVTWALIGVMSVVFSVAIVALAGTAGWTAGQREAASNANATRSAEVATQCALFASDVDSGNLVVLNARYEYLVTLTPAVSCAAVIPATATALYLTSLPTATATATVTPSPTATLAVTATPEAMATSANGGFDLTALLGEAQDYITIRDWESAIETLDVIIGLDPDFESGTVRSLMSQSMNALARQYYRMTCTVDSCGLAQAIYWSDRALEFGPLDDDLPYERYVAAIYLDAARTEGTDYATTIQAWQRVYNENPNYQDAAQRLFNAYVGYGRAWAAQGEFCPAYQQFQSALSIFNDALVSSESNNANTMCQQATPIPLPGSIPAVTPGTSDGSPTIVPVGQQP
ncbi:MAG: tetratricopeptide repeat protein [Anaerolineae bacterium]